MNGWHLKKYSSWHVLQDIILDLNGLFRIRRGKTVLTIQTYNDGIVAIAFSHMEQESLDKAFK